MQLQIKRYHGGARAVEGPDTNGRWAEAQLRTEGEEGLARWEGGKLRAHRAEFRPLREPTDRKGPVSHTDQCVG